MTYLETKSGETVSLEYQDGLLQTIVRNDQPIFQIRRGQNGLISSVSDFHGRTVEYRYSQRGRLSVVQDPGQNLWKHQYGTDGRLVRAMGGNGEPYLNVMYDHLGRVLRSGTGREYEFKYEGPFTTIKELTGQSHLFRRNESGITVQLRSTTGVKWDIDLNQNNFVESLQFPTREYEFTYDSDHLLMEIELRTSSYTRNYRYGYDDLHRLVSVESPFQYETLEVHYVDNQVQVESPSEELTYTTDEYGVLSVSKGLDMVSVERDTSGLVTSLDYKDRTVRLTRDALGRIGKIQYPDGLTNSYSYDPLGNRNRIEHGNGGSVDYAHDHAGNIVQVDVQQADGSTRTQRTIVGPMNRVERIQYGDEVTVAISYDDMARPNLIAVNSEIVSVDYTPLGVLDHLSSISAGLEWRGDGSLAQGALEIDWKLHSLANESSATDIGFEVLTFNPVTFEVTLSSVQNRSIPSYIDARALVKVSHILFDQDPLRAVQSFEKPSNSIFQPREYRSTNCCVGCAFPTICTGCSTPGSIGPGICYCFPLEANPGSGGGGGGGSATTEVDRIIAEYREYKLKPVPQSTDFTKDGHSKNFSTSEYNGSDNRATGHNHNYFIMGVMDTMAEGIRDLYNEEFNKDGSTNYGLRLTSGYRCPEKNKAVGGELNSRHMWGHAVDLVPAMGNLPEGVTPEDAWEKLRRAAREFARRNQGYRVVDETKDASNKHIHIQYTP